MSTAIPNGRYHFRPWVRRGVGADAGAPDAPGLPARASLNVTLTVSAQQGPATVDASPAPQLTVHLYGPGDVIGLDPRHVVRTEPRHLTPNFEPNYLAGIEFDQSDLPWQFTPAQPNGDRLRPWLALVVLKDGEYAVPKVAPNPLPVIDVTDVAGLQPLADSWNWAHAQISAETDLGTTITANPGAAVSRLLCPRRLDPETAYTALLVPAFEIGRQAGLGLDVSAVATADPAWTDATAAPLRLPVYYRFDFQTSDAGDFESLVRKLTPTVLPAAVGVAPLAVDHPADSVPSAGPPLGLEGALRSASTTPSDWTGPDRDAFQTAVQDLVNQGTATAVDDPDDPLPDDPRIVPPAYGQWHAGATSVDRTDPGWLGGLNLDPRNRSGAGMGTQIVQDERVALLASAWQQVDGVLAANATLRQAQLSRAALTRLWTQHLQVAAVPTLLALTSPLHTRMLASPRTVAAAVNASRVPGRVLSGAYRRVARPFGPTARRAAVLSGVSPAGPRAPGASVLERINAGTLRVAPPPPKPSGLTSLDDVSAAVESGELPKNWPVWLRRLLLWLLRILAGLLDQLRRWVPSAVQGLVGRLLNQLITWLQGLLGPEEVAVDLRYGALTGDRIRSAPPATDFVVTEPPSGLGGGGPGAGGSGSASGTPGQDSAAAARLRAAAGEMLDAVHAAPADPPLAAALDLPALHQTVLTRLDPATTVVARVGELVSVTSGPWFPADPLEPIMAAPDYPQPMYQPLRDLNQDYLLPGVELIPPDILGAVVANHTFIEAYMVGLNHELARQLLWNGYPTDQRGSYFRQFWDVAGYLPQAGDPTDPAQLTELLKDIPPIHTWPRPKPLGQNENRTDVVVDNVVLLVRGELLRRYPNTVIFAGKASSGTGGEHGRVLDETDERYPIFRGTLTPDITFFGFNLSVDDARGGTTTAPEGFFFVLQEQPTETRFGLEPQATGTVGKWADLAWTNFGGPAPGLRAAVAGFAPAAVSVNPATGTLTESSVSSVFPGLHPSEIAHYRVASSVFASVLASRPVPDFLTAGDAPSGVTLDGSNPEDAAAAWGKDAAQTAAITLRLPFRILVHADSLLPPEDIMTQDLAPPPLIADGRDESPLLLLPVRLETRFVDGTGDPQTEAPSSELWLRIYPGPIMIDAHHPELTPAEAAAGDAYWDDLWRAGKPPPDKDAVQAPWRGLVSRFGAPRAAWIARACTPLNVGDRPAAPTAPGGTPVPARQRATPTQSPDSWQQPAVADLLPSFWNVALISPADTVTATGSPVVTPLAMSLSPADPSLVNGFPDGLPVDDAMRWLVDFDAAVAAGMALRIPITVAQRAAGFDRVLVYGLAAPPVETDIPSGASTFGGLLDAHHYSDGLAFVPQGAPTNNTPDAPSAYHRDDPDAALSYAVEQGEPLTADPTADGPLAAQLLGVPVSGFDHVAQADRYDQRDSADMITAIWAATFGYFLGQLGDGKLTESQVESARRWTITHVRPRGPLPALRTGVTPYGVLPVTSTARWRPSGDPVEAAILQVVRRLLPTWVSSASAAPHLGATPGDPDADLISVLSQDASSMTFRGRTVFGDELLWNLLSFEGLPASAAQGWWAGHLAPARDLLDQLGFIGWDARLTHLGLAPTDYPINAPTVVAGPLSETDPLPDDATLGGVAMNYVTWLRRAPITDVRANNYPGPAVPDTLLYRILRQSVLLDYVTLAQSAQLRSGLLALSQTREQELVGIATVNPAAPQQAPAEPAAAAAALEQLTPWQVLARPVSADNQISWADYLHALDPEVGSPFARLAELRASLDRLAALPTAELDRLLTETLDLASHRLDAWVTALATSRLQAGSAPNQQVPAPPRTGAYGWVENLRPATAALPVDDAAAKLVADLDTRRARLYPNTPCPAPAQQAPADNGGYIHAPSLAQASTAAVLRSGYLSHQGGPEDGLLALDLSADRVRGALWLLDGVRQGQPLGALLGYQLETAMHTAGLDKYIQPLRDRFPIAAGKLTPASPGAEVLGAADVVDALALERARADETLSDTGDWGTGLPAPGSDRTALLGLFAGLDDLLDALTDLGVAEAVFQTMRGNPDRAAGTLDAVAQAQPAPPPQVVDTPRGGTDQTHRALLLLAGQPAKPAAWTALPATPRGLAEPGLDAWVAGLLPDPGTIEAVVSYTVANGPVVSSNVAVADLGLGPLDVLAVCRITADAQRSEFDDRVLYQVLPPGAVDVAIRYTPAPGVLGVPDLLNVARAVDDLIAGARPLTADDLALPETTVAAGIDVADLNARATTARNGATAVLADLATAAAGPADPDTARDAILATACYGLPGAVPASRRGSGPDPSLTVQARSLHDTLATRVAAAAAITLSGSDPGPAGQVLTEIFGKGFTVLPRFTPPAAVTLRAGFGQDPAAIGADPVALDRWTQQLTHVRPGLSRLDLAYLLAEVVAGAPADPVGIAQLPPATGPDRWLALAPAAGQEPINGRLALVARLAGDVTDPSLTWSGLLIDAWPERIPAAQQSAAVAFHHDDPKARAPQALLLAAQPDPQRGWDDDTIRTVLSETLDLAHARTVDLASVGAVGQVLPALYFPFNLHEDTVSMLLQRPLVTNLNLLDEAGGS